MRNILRATKHRLLFFLLSMCAYPTEVFAMDILALRGRWVLESIDGKPVSTGQEEIFLLVTEQTITGFDGCNRFGGEAAAPYMMRKSQRACPPGTVLLPLDFSDPARQLGRAIVRDDKLFLPLPDGKGEAQFRRG